ncbi:MAG: hypothetical protein M3454_13040 [Actinomycetota bacterium]|nr:hypothetical protein [Actinomycetota bacterium]
MKVRVILGAALSVVAVVAGVIVFPTRVETVVVGWASTVLVWAAIECSGAMRRMVPGAGSSFESLLKRPGRTRPRPADLERCERLLAWGRYSPRDFDHHVRPVLVELLRRRLETSSAPLDPELTALLAGNPAEDTYGRGLSTRDLERIVLSIESL